MTEGHKPEQTYTEEEFRRLVEKDCLAIVKSFAERNFYWIAHLPIGKGVADLIQEAMVLVWQGRRKWYGGKPPPGKMQCLLCATVKQLAVREFERYEREKAAIGGAEMTIACHSVAAEQAEENAARLLYKLKKLVGDDPLLPSIFDHLFYHPEHGKAAEIAQALGVEVERIYQANVRLQRKRRSLLENVKRRHT